MMNVFRLLLVLFFVPLGHAAESAPGTRNARFDAEERFEVQATIPAGSDHAILEISHDLAAWRAVIAGEIDGRAARVMGGTTGGVVGAGAFQRDLR